MVSRTSNYFCKFLAQTTSWSCLVQPHRHSDGLHDKVWSPALCQHEQNIIMYLNTEIIWNIMWWHSWTGIKCLTLLQPDSILTLFLHIIWGENRLQPPSRNTMLEFLKFSDSPDETSNLSHSSYFQSFPDQLLLLSRLLIRQNNADCHFNIKLQSPLSRILKIRNT